MGQAVLIQFWPATTATESTIAAAGPPGQCLREAGWGYEHSCTVAMPSLGEEGPLGGGCAADINVAPTVKQPLLHDLLSAVGGGARVCLQPLEQATLTKSGGGGSATLRCSGFEERSQATLESSGSAGSTRASLRCSGGEDRAALQSSGGGDMAQGTPRSSGGEERAKGKGKVVPTVLQISGGGDRLQATPLPLELPPHPTRPLHERAILPSGPDRGWDRSGEQPVGSTGERPVGSTGKEMEGRIREDTQGWPRTGLARERRGGQDMEGWTGNDTEGWTGDELALVRHGGHDMEGWTGDNKEGWAGCGLDAGRAYPCFNAPCVAHDHTAHPLYLETPGGGARGDRGDTPGGRSRGGKDTPGGGARAGGGDTSGGRTKREGADEGSGPGPRVVQRLDVPKVVQGLGVGLGPSPTRHQKQEGLPSSFHLAADSRLYQARRIFFPKVFFPLSE